MFKYTLHCLDNDFASKGHVLQDVVNEFGRRLDFIVEDGRYHGVRNAIGFDGTWRRKDAPDIVVEVKTTDRYLIDLDTLARYRTRLQQDGRADAEASILIIAPVTIDLFRIRDSEFGCSHPLWERAGVRVERSDCHQFGNAQ